MGSGIQEGSVRCERWVTIAERERPGLSTSIFAYTELDCKADIAMLVDLCTLTTVSRYLHCTDVTVKDNE